MDEPLADLSALGFLALSRARGAARDRRALRPGRRRAARRLPQAPRGGDRRRVVARCRRPAAPRRRAPCARPLRRARRTLGADGPRRAPPRAERRTRRGAARSARHRTSRACATAAARLRRERLATGDADALGDALYLDAQLALVGRHAPLLRPRLDGALARGASAVPRPPARRTVRDDPVRVQGPRLPTQVPAQARSARARARSDHRQAEGRLLQSVGGGLVPRADGRRGRRLPARPGRAVTELVDRTARRVARALTQPRQRDVRGCSRVLMLEIWLRTFLPRAVESYATPA